MTGVALTLGCVIILPLVLKAFVRRLASDVPLWLRALRCAGCLRLSLLRLCKGSGEVLYVQDGVAQRLPRPPPKPEGFVRCVCISDTHLYHRQLRLPVGDILLHAGDILLQNRAVDAHSVEQLTDFNSWLAGLPFKEKIVVGGNHDSALCALGRAGAQRILCSATYLENSTVEARGLRIHGSPLSVGKTANSAFQSHGGFDEGSALAAIPEGLDILMTHGPPGSDWRSMGRASAGLAKCIEIATPRYHVCGHDHLGYGVSKSHDTVFVNASSADAFFAVSHPPVVLDILPVR